MNILIAGASGFIGQNLITHLKQNPDFNIRALSRKLDKLVQSADGVTWVRGNLYSLYDAERAMKNCDVAIYLVHSMHPTAHLSQGCFSEFDLILADNFARAADKCGVKQIIFLGGLIPQTSSPEELSLHLKSRAEVGKVLLNSSVPATLLRASIVIGPMGSSFRIVENVVKRLPFLLCPKESENLTEPVDIIDVVRSVEFCILNPKTYDQSFNLGASNVISYLDLLKLTAKTMGLKRTIVPSRWISIRFATFWTVLFGGQPYSLVEPLINSLKHDMITKKNKLIPGFFYIETNLERSVKRACTQKQKFAHTPRVVTDPQTLKYSVRSVQRLVHSYPYNAIWLTRQYMHWLDTRFRFLIVVKGEGAYREFLLFGRICLLRLHLSINRSTPNRQLFYICGGLLDSGHNPRARIEFRLIGPNRIALAAIHDYYPTLPWGIYRYTQALIHKFVMYRFSQYLKNWELKKKHRSSHTNAFSLKNKSM